ncbi:hypothetical protein [Ruminococcus sp.]|uniref:hypothetical protein n=1 Tax=Ruminococcus sp. TaxID=41978 RepID=UPI0025FCE191|nr:hypothetical protein [Ruminococcus sp.]MBQ8967556.1 hypothetical protein [Ruminococcus sp.]
MSFERKQINDLITGTALCAELPAACEGDRRFVLIIPYVINEQGTKDIPDKILDEAKYESTLFCLRDYEYPADYIANDFEVSDKDVIRLRDEGEIKGISALQDMLAEFVSDFSIFVPSWETDDILY